ncbi:hypothetical protein B0O80DRAFT_431112 [Mortierella sp. GBAus27b]|nr:hypothetical protein B0O80DRAFT_431112 [Mortierella sp. GBAus27b]
MFFRTIVPAPKISLSPHQALELIGIFLDGAKKAKDDDVVLTLCHHTEAALSQAKGSTKKGSASTDPEDLCERIAEAYVDLARLMEGREHRVEAQALYKKAQKLE